MNIHIVSTKRMPSVDVEIVGVFEDQKTPKGTDAAASAIIATRQLQEKFGKLYDLRLIPSTDRRVKKAFAVIGLGKAKTFNIAKARNVVASAVRGIAPIKPSTVSVSLKDVGGESMLEAVIDGVVFGVYEHHYKTEKKEQRITDVTIVTDARDAESRTNHARIIADAVSFVRKLVDEPANTMTPTRLADRAKELERFSGITTRIIGEKEAKAMGMGAFAAVSQGSDEEGKVIVVEYKGSAKKDKPVIGLVGKGITFDTGGLSLKSDKAMETMKCDMAGAATVLGIIAALAQKKAPVRVIGIAMAAENSPSGKAIRPGDVVMALSGKTVEILNTDAEGRLVVADGVTYADRLGATHIIDLATLTGACMVALGSEIVGLFSGDAPLAEKLMQASKKTGERVWQLPMDEDFDEEIKGTIADYKNVGEKYGGATTAAKFIQLVSATKKPWVHLDIAGPSFEEKGKPWMGKGGTGVMVRTLVQLTEEMSA
ncbi:MAG: leucyl aminopeptidase [bacterium]|nr:leucyl aminopeptidase [bacterium]